MSSDRIGYLTSRYPGTSHTFIRREVDEMKRRGVHLDTFSVRRPFAFELVAEADKAAFAQTTYVLPVAIWTLITAHVSAIFSRPVRYFRTLWLAMQHRPPGFRPCALALFHFVESVVLAKALQKQGITHVHNHFANSGATVGLLATQFLGLPWSLTLHGISETDYPAGLLLGKKVEHATFVACVSWFGRAQAMRVTAPEYWHKFMIVRCALDLAHLPPGKAQTDHRDQPFRIICVGRLSAEKAHIGLLHAFARLVSEGVQCKLVLVGDGPESKAIQSAAASLGLAEAVEFRGRLDEADTLQEIAASDLLVLPSFMEGLPVVLMEAMALGVPVIASRVSGIPELIEDGVEGLLFRPADWSDLHVVMGKMIADADLRHRLAVAARSKIEREFEISKAIAPLLVKFTHIAPEDVRLDQRSGSDSQESAVARSH